MNNMKYEMVLWYRELVCICVALPAAECCKYRLCVARTGLLV